MLSKFSKKFFTIFITSHPSLIYQPPYNTIMVRRVLSTCFGCAYYLFGPHTNTHITPSHTDTLTEHALGIYKHHRCKHREPQIWPKNLSTTNLSIILHCKIQSLSFELFSKLHCSLKHNINLLFIFDTSKVNLHSNVSNFSAVLDNDQ